MERIFESIAVNEPGQLIVKLNEWEKNFKDIKIHSSTMGLSPLKVPILIYLVEFTFNTKEEKEKFIEVLHPKVNSKLNLA